MLSRRYRQISHGSNDYADMDIFIAIRARFAVLIERLVRPHHSALVPLLADAIETEAVLRQDSQIIFMLLVNGIGKTVAYGHVLSPFSGLPRRPVAAHYAMLTELPGS